MKTRIVLRRGSIQPTSTQVTRIRTEIEKLRSHDILVYHVFVDKASFHIEEVDRMFFWNAADVPPTPKPTKVSPVDDTHSYSVECPDCGDELGGSNLTRGTSVTFTRRCTCFMRVTLTRDADGWDAHAEKIVPRFTASSEG